MQGFWFEGFVCRKAVKSRSLILGFSFQILVQLTILGEHLSNSIHGGKTIIFHHPNNHIHHQHLSLLTLCGKRVKQSQTVRSGRFESNLLTWPGRPKHTHWNRVTHATVPFNSRFTEQAHRPQVQQYDDSVLAIS